MIKMVVDSTCDLPKELIERCDIEMLPMRVLLEDKEYLDKKTITVEEAYLAMRRGVVPVTSQIRPGDLYDLFQKYCDEKKDFIYLAFSSVLSGTCHLAERIAEEFTEKYPDINIAVVDSKGGSTATGLIALQAVKLIEAGFEFNRIVDEIRYLAEHVEHIFTITDLNWLIKGGRIGRTQGKIGSMLDIKPILHVNNGYMEVIRKVRGRKKALSTVVDILEQRIEKFPEQIIGVSHADDLETAKELMELMGKRLRCRNFLVNKIGSVLGSHLGIGGVGVFFFNEKSNNYME